MTDRDPAPLPHEPVPQAAVPYEKAAPNDYRWTSAAYDEILSGAIAVDLVARSGVRTARVSGSCPRCGHELNVSQILEAVTGEQSSPLRTSRNAGADDAEGDYVELVAGCRCDAPHTGRPDGTAFGCGINFLVEIAVD